MCKFEAERIIKETLKRYYCRFICSTLEDGLLIVRYVDKWGNYRKSYFPYRYMTEKDVENKIRKVVYKNE